jgi:hypothetical protein
MRDKLAIHRNNVKQYETRIKQITSEIKDWPKSHRYYQRVLYLRGKLIAYSKIKERHLQKLNKHLEQLSESLERYICPDVVTNILIEYL